MSASSKIIKAPVLEEMASFEGYFKNAMASKIPFLQTIVNYLLRRKGKQLRPTIVFLTAKLNGAVNEKTYVAASMIEMLHTATLIHDDVVDEAYERRGALSINAMWRSKIAVLLGDYLLARGLQLAVNSSSFDLLRIMSEAVKEMSEGELLQIEKARKLDITEEVYFDIIRKKTATLIASCAANGAQSVGADPAVVQQMKQYGEYIGIAFQLKDDLFDYQHTNLVGKPTGNDIKEKKMTLPLIHALQHAPKDERKRVLKLVRGARSKPKNVGEVVDFVAASGGIAYTEQQMLEYRDRAIELLAGYPESDVKAALVELAHYTTQRSK
ncbi:polyprenyl synthetase family protein [uncultured Acetobacteroides sp.]|uniref:polyprenyl synthetase family protein n=1 Tax=uncultured Acetobacteroides sp. TaxID=1760811 RepID=UPI0029F477E5|nr:polyprenyl synthetase family protein [uncultured Acetobacteroides sp.]